MNNFNILKHKVKSYYHIEYYKSLKTLPGCAKPGLENSRDSVCIWKVAASKIFYSSNDYEAL